GLAERIENDLRPAVVDRLRGARLGDRLRPPPLALPRGRLPVEFGQGRDRLRRTRRRGQRRDERLVVGLAEREERPFANGGLLACKSFHDLGPRGRDRAANPIDRREDGISRKEVPLL